MELGRFKLIEQADQISDTIWNEVTQWNFFNKDTVGKQMVRAADSISANLSEAYGRYTFPDRKRFSIYARGSLCETLNWIEKSIERNLVEEELGNELLVSLQKLSVNISRYIKSLNTSITNPS